MHGGNSDPISRHNAIRDVVFNAAQSAALGPSKETPGLVPDSASRPADVLLPNWTNGRPAALDVHVISPGSSLSSGRNPRWFSRGLHLYHPGYRQINWSSFRCRRRQNHNQTPIWKGEHSSLAWQRSMHISTGLPLSHLHWMDTLRISIFLIFSYSFVLYPLVCSLLALNYIVQKKKKTELWFVTIVDYSLLANPQFLH